MKHKRTPWQKIRDAGIKGTELRLTFEECQELSIDLAIIRKAENDDDEQDEKLNESRRDS